MKKKSEYQVVCVSQTFHVHHFIQLHTNNHTHNTVCKSDFLCFFFFGSGNLFFLKKDILHKKEREITRKTEKKET